MLDRYRKKRSQEVDLNLTPIMNLFVAMIPFLLMCASFYTVSVVNASVPSSGEQEESDLAKGDDKITLTVQVRRGVGYKVTAQSDTLAEADLDRISTDLPPVGGKLDTKGLSDLVMDVKARYPKSDTAIVLPEEEIFYEQLIETMDALREKLVIEKGEEIYEVLLPVIVVSSVAKGKPAEEAGAEGAAPAAGGTP